MPDFPDQMTGTGLFPLSEEAFPARAQPARRTVIAVSLLNRRVRELIEAGASRLWVRGEISNLATPTSGHLYFTLKDRTAQVRCAFFRGNNRTLRQPLENGMEVIVEANASLYEVRGEFQLVVRALEQEGEGALLRAFERLKKKLAAEGLFNADQKQELPVSPRSIGLVTSPTGAAIRDVLSVLRRRHSLARLIIYPTPVQGRESVETISHMLAIADARRECEVLLLVRGGGSLEDLQAFNSEQVARAIHACRLPLVTGVGHEIDITIADFVADQRAPTPSAAAELVSPDRAETLRKLTVSRQRLHQQARHLLLSARHRLQELHRQITEPTRQIWHLQQRCDGHRARLERLTRACLDARVRRLSVLAARLQQHNPIRYLRVQRQRAAQMRRRLSPAIRSFIRLRRQEFAQRVRALQAANPQAILQRGYAIVSHRDSGRIVRRPADVRDGDILSSRLAEGEIISRVQE